MRKASGAWIAVGALSLYVASFAGLVVAGHKKDWPIGYAFRYSRQPALDYVLGMLYQPAYRVAQALGAERLFSAWPSAE